MPEPHQQLFQGQPPAYSRPPYSPPQYLLSSTGLSRDDLVAQYEAFIHSLQHVEIAPELVFERMIGNLNDVFNTTLSRQNAQHATAEEEWHREKIALEAELARATATAKKAEKDPAEEEWRREKIALKAELARATAAAQKAEKAPAPSVSLAPVVAPPTAADINHTYLQIWYPSSPGTVGVHLAATSVPIPYGLARSWPSLERINFSPDYGSYDTRMDPLITTTPLQTVIIHIVRFKKPFPTPPSVLVWLTGLGAKGGASVCVKATANNVTESEFALQISSDGGERLGSVGVAWAVWQQTTVRGQPTLQAGSVSTVVAGAPRLPYLNTEGTLGVPWVLFAALCEVDMVLSGGVWMNVQVGPRGCYYGTEATWSMDAGPLDARVYSASIAYAYH